jgi:cell division protein ZapA
VSKESVKVRILDREFTITCPPGEREDLEAAADYLNGQLQIVQDQSKVIGLEHTVVLAALNLSNELLRLRRDGGEGDDALQRLRELREKVSAATDPGETLRL